MEAGVSAWRAGISLSLALNMQCCTATLPKELWLTLRADRPGWPKSERHRAVKNLVDICTQRGTPFLLRRINLFRSPHPLISPQSPAAYHGRA